MDSTANCLAHVVKLMQEHESGLQQVIRLAEDEILGARVGRLSTGAVSFKDAVKRQYDGVFEQRVDVCLQEA
jgi:hypothetical protein